MLRKNRDYANDEVLRAVFSIVSIAAAALESNKYKDLYARYGSKYSALLDERVQDVSYPDLKAFLSVIQEGLDAAEQLAKAQAELPADTQQKDSESLEKLSDENNQSEAPRQEDDDDYYEEPFHDPLKGTYYNDDYARPTERWRDFTLKHTSLPKEDPIAINYNLQSDVKKVIITTFHDLKYTAIVYPWKTREIFTTYFLIAVYHLKHLYQQVLFCQDLYQGGKLVHFRGVFSHVRPSVKSLNPYIASTQESSLFASYLIDTQRVHRAALAVAIWQGFQALHSESIRPELP